MMVNKWLLVLAFVVIGLVVLNVGCPADQVAAEHVQRNESGRVDGQCDCVVLDMEDFRHVYNCMCPNRYGNYRQCVAFVNGAYGGVQMDCGE